MVLAILLVLVVASARLVIWRWHADTRLFTLAMFAVVISRMAGLPRIGDRHLDPALAAVFGENISDLIVTTFLAVASWLLGMIGLRALTRTQDRQSSRRRYQRAATVWSVVQLAVIVALILTSRLGEAARTPVSDEFALTDSASLGYIGVYLFEIALIGAVLIAVCGKALRTSRIRLRHAMMAVTALTVCGLGYVAFVVWALVANPSMLREHHSAIIATAAAPALVALAVAGLYGLVAALGS
ncbi:hypothetical protein [Nocardia sp. NPDC049707]|uniref:hypothetical protein n=1 Tax=Nocardia sp. NPDC049707 TaxID=3154735 RepID=UPI0034163E9F